MNKNQSPNHIEPIEKRRTQFKFSLFSSASDAWILAIALLILLFISFINERKAIHSTLKQMPDQSENNMVIKNLATGIYITMGEKKI